MVVAVAAAVCAAVIVAHNSEQKDPYVIYLCVARVFLCALHLLLLTAPIAAWASVGRNVDGPHRDRDDTDYDGGGGGAPAQLHTAAHRAALHRAAAGG